mmetsp:Transcript_13360/g.41917  ORF Transcript_13360/g.41917 Transcript_13360/m.41917 type:complete len:212 (+) Transcript_13360:658-1293(+)
MVANSCGERCALHIPRFSSCLRSIADVAGLSATFACCASLQLRTASMRHESGTRVPATTAATTIPSVATVASRTRVVAGEVEGSPSGISTHALHALPMTYTSFDVSKRCFLACAIRVTMPRCTSATLSLLCDTSLCSAGKLVSVSLSKPSGLTPGGGEEAVALAMLSRLTFTLAYVGFALTSVVSTPIRTASLRKRSIASLHPSSTRLMLA